MATRDTQHSQQLDDSGVTAGADVLDRQISRRRFLQGTAAAGATLAFAGSLGVQLAGAAPRVTKGGRLRIGTSGGGAAETLNVTQLHQEIDTMRALILFDRLVDITPDGKLFNNLAAEFSPSKDAKVWKIKLRDTVFHNGKKLTAADVVYTFRYILAPKNAATGRPLFSSLFRSGDIRALDKSTVEVRLLRPLAVLPNSFSSQQYGIFPEGTTSWDHPIGTGAFMFKSWTRGERSLFVRNPHFRESGHPYLDEIEIIAINDSTALYNALVGGQVDAVPRLDPSLVAGVKQNSRLRLLQGPTGVHTDMTMAVDLDPFKDSRVRQAFRLMVDRKQMVSNALGGNGRIGNDLPTPYDADYASAIPQRAHDPEKARSLLKAAGQEGLTVSLYTSDAGPAMVESATLFAEQAKAAGVTVKLDKVSADHYYDSSGKFLKTAFAQDTWSYRTLPNAMADAYVSASPFNETHWKRPKFDALVAQAERTLDAKKRHELWVEVQRELWNEGGFIIWGFIDNLDAISAKVHGVKSSVARPLGRYDFTDTYLA
jgi:peptide/nickel transport system substrate-binding protein